MPNQRRSMQPPSEESHDAKASSRVSRSYVRNRSLRYNLRSRGKQEDAALRLQWDALNRLLAPQYVTLAFNLPPGSSTIWQSMEEDIMLSWDANCPPSNRLDLFSFLLRFFSPCLVAIVHKNLVRLDYSFLGIEYTMRLGKASLASRILDDTVHDHVYRKGGPLAGFLGDAGHADSEACDAGDSGTGGKGGHADEGWQEVRKKKGGSRQRSSEPPFGGSGSHTSRGGRRGGGGRRGRGEAAVSEEHFTDLHMVEVLLPVYKTPPKVPKEARGEQAQVAKRQRDISIAERSLLFCDHPLVNEGAPYNPKVEAIGNIHLFHGIRASSLGGRHGFRAKGIKPPCKKNEFCAEEAFYISNSVRHAYEHPLHHHPSRGMEDPIVVFVFDIDVEVLHGNKPPPGSDVLFKVTWFEEPNDEWEEFCRGNMEGELPREDADIVIGPICRVKPPPQRYEAMQVELEGGVQLNQIALCSTRAWQWLEMCTIRMYSEKRCQNM